MNIVTFIIPTIGRDTLNRSIESILNQTIEDWNIIIIFDGIKSNIDMNYINDKRIKIIEIKKKGFYINCAGNVRNEGIKYAKTEWIAFLDDDDTISHDYIETFYKELELSPYLDVLIFRMMINDRIIPKLETNNFYLNDVGISFIMKRSIYSSGTIFIADGAEDFLYLDKIRKLGYKIIISQYIKYFVRNEPFFTDIIGNRVIINSNFIIFLSYLYVSSFISKNNNIQR
jgi:glycosyltransferase involved in cell wall biosynthesis